MQQLVGRMRRCVEDYHMIGHGDRIAVGLSGGVDSVVTLAGLLKLREFYPKPFALEAITLDLGIPEMDYTPLVDYCARHEVPYTVVRTQIAHVVFEERREKNPCSLCAKMRRGALGRALCDRGLNKVALGHHFDDAVETFLLSLVYEGRISCFQPVTYLSRTGITQIRPLLYVGKGTVSRIAAQEGLPTVPNLCPANGNTKRQEVKELLLELERNYPGLRSRIFGAMQRLPLKAWETDGKPEPRQP
jgi:tRNA(Ile)-lysidine synthase TilS/MesJ